MVMGVALTIGFAEVDYKAFLTSFFGSYNICAYFDFPPSTYVLPALYAFFPIMAFIYTAASIFRAWISLEEKKMSTCSFTLYILAFVFFFLTTVIFTTIFAIQPEVKKPGTVELHTIPFTNLIVGVTLLQFATT